MRPIYLDYNATTPIDPEVAEYMIPFLKGTFGNPSSTHHFGIEARQAMSRARKSVASLLSCKPAEIIFTSGGTESNNLAVKGVAYAKKNHGNHIITSEIEHPAVLEVCKNLEKEGFEVSYLRADKEGKVILSELVKAICPATILVSIMHANNETGIIQPIREIAEILKPHGIIFHTDAAQSTGKIPVNVDDLGVDLLSLAAHKFYGPKGTGALYIREGISLEKILHGANHERNLRPGTENLLEVAGMGKAAEVAERDLSRNSSKMSRTRDKLYHLFKESFPDCKWNGNPGDCLPNTLNISFAGIDVATLLASVPEIAVSAGAACHAENVTISHVLQAMHLSRDEAMGTIRISTGKNTTMEEAEEAAGVLIEKIRQLRTAGGEVKSADETEDIRLTRFTHGLGCACKISPRILEEVLSKLPIPAHPDILVGTETSDDAAVYRINSTTAIVQTLDFFTPIVDEPFEFGAIAAANALSDIYAMGAKPLFGLNIVAFPPHRLPLRVLQQILEGAQEVAEEAGIQIIGGHTIEDNEPKYGLVITGTIHPEKILRNKGAIVKDHIILTKKLGTGILSTALKRELCDENTRRALYQSMRQLNKAAGEIIAGFPVSSCTDVTGFGFLGHLKEICAGSRLSARVFHDKLPLLPGTEEFAASGIIPGGTENNLSYLSEHVSFEEKIPGYKKYIAADAQTSGGLLFTVRPEVSSEIVKQLNDSGIDAVIVGEIIPISDKWIYFL